MTDTAGAPTSTTGSTPAFIAYEYCTVRVDRDLESLYKDAYRSFGWHLEGYSSLPGAGSVSLKFKRDRRIPNRATVLELQRRCDSALTQISGLQRAQRAVPVTAAAGVGVIGCAFLAGSVFSLQTEMIPVSVVLGVVGLLCWLLGWLTHGWVRTRRAARSAPRIDAQFDVVYDTGEQAARLLA